MRLCSCWREMISREHELGHEERVAQIGEPVGETLRGMDGVQSVQVGFGVFANEHFSSRGFNLCRSLA